ncbi:MAG: universal stress protein [Haloarculaceae archaeon]
MNESSGDGEFPEVTATGGAQRHVLYPVVESESDATGRVAASVAAALDATLFVGPVDTTATGTTVEDRHAAAERAFRTDAGSPVDVTARGVVLSGATPLAAVASAVRDHGVDAVVLESDAADRLEPRLARRVDSDVVVVNGHGGVESIASLLVPVSRGPHAGGAVGVAGAIARANDAWLELVHFHDGSDPGRADEILAGGAATAPDDVPVDTRPVEADDPVEGIVEESNYHDATVVGAPRKGRLKRLVFGSTTAEVRDRAPNTVVTVKRNGEGDSLLPGRIE